MSVEHVTFLYEETAKDAAARLARGTGNAGEDLNAYDEDLRSAVCRCGDDTHESLHHGSVTYTGMRRDMREDGSSSIEIRFEVELIALSDDYRPKSVCIMDREGGHTCVLRLTHSHMRRFVGTAA